MVAGSDWPQVPALAVGEAPETGDAPAVAAADAVNNAPTAQLEQPNLTQSNQRMSGPAELKRPVEVVLNTYQPSNKQQQPKQQQPSQTYVAVAAAAGSASQEPTELQLSSFAWNLLATDAGSTAPACPFSPTRKNSVSDSQGRLWSLANGRECTFKVPSAAARSAAEAAGAELTWEGAPLCTAVPSKASAVADPAGNLWGYEDGASCTFKQEDGGSVKLKNTPTTLPMLWEQAPVCDIAPTKESSNADVMGRLWGVDMMGRGCTFRVG
eukprot:GHRQ01033603.1.p1 GENE.GHRQ01033603.1~~GHRQ01033603.1.p1  ORF type:complete len:275 (-),score=70.37 GHRQ01033603.1:119-922(-)